MDAYDGFGGEPAEVEDDSDLVPTITWMELYLERYRSGDPLKDYYDESELQEVLAEMCHWLIVLSQLKLTKMCSVCLRCFPMNAFHIDCTSEDGYHHRCKSCKNKANVKIEREEVEDSNGSTIAD
ncbi:hypothetical protein LCGC14_1758850 [marine sediment metagenome]|uniref:Uncharacterized protein n=1 Tax=marine sediment metagenome TaxID=412755 RepID=A0A0F9H1Q6_9ZZZZ